MDNNDVDKMKGMGATEETSTLYSIENDIAASTTDTTVDIEITGVDVGNKGVRVQITGVGVDTPGVQDISHE